MTDARPRLSHPQRHRAMVDSYGFGLFPLPPLREARVGEWRIVRHLSSLADGYLTGSVFEAGRHVLYHRRTPWMSSGLMEQESHAVHVGNAAGVVVAAGLGMGVYVYAVSLKPEVEKVVVIEREADVIALTAQAAGLENWPERDKLVIIAGDARTPEVAAEVAVVSGGRPPDYLFADIWPICAAPDAPSETAAMARALNPRSAGWWGQELSFGLWCREWGRPPEEATLCAYAAAVGVPIPVTNGYALFCRDVIAANLAPAKAPGPLKAWIERWRGRLRS